MGNISLSKFLARKSYPMKFWLVFYNDNSGLLFSVFMAAVVLEIVTALGLASSEHFK